MKTSQVSIVTVCSSLRNEGSIRSIKIIKPSTAKNVDEIAIATTVFERKYPTQHWLPTDEVVSRGSKLINISEFARELSKFEGEQVSIRIGSESALEGILTK